jgi:uncharacterized protein
MEEYFLTKDISIDAVKDIDETKGIITGYFSIFGNKDSDGDIILPGAFRKTLKENGPDSEKPRILHLFQHDVGKPLAKPSVLKEDKKGLYFESQISQTALGKDVIQLYKDKVLTEHSIGYQIVKREVDEQAEVQKLMELKLWEGSTVSWGANMEALVSSVKGENLPDKQTWDVLIQKLEALNTAVKGNYTDDTARSLEIQLKQVQQLVISLATKMTPGKSTPIIEEPKKSFTADDIMKIIKSNIKNLK